MERFKKLVRRRSEAVSVSSKAVDQLKVVQGEIQQEIKNAEGVIASLELQIENQRKQIQDQREAITFLQSEAERAAKSAERLSEIIVNQ